MTDAAPTGTGSIASTLRMPQRGPGIRVYLARDGDALVVLFGGGSKATQSKDVLRAKTLLLEYKSRKRASAAADKKQRK